MKRLLRRLLLLGSILAGAISLPAAEAPRPAAPTPAEVVADTPPVQLAPVETKADIMPEYASWIKVGSPHYIVYTDATESKAHEALQRLEKIHYAAQVYFQRRMPNLPPIVVVLPTGWAETSQVKDRDNLEWVRGASGQASQMADVIVADGDWRSEGLAEEPAVTMELVIRQQEENVRLARAREIYGLKGVFMIQGRKLLDRMYPAGPFWFQRGAMQFFANLTLTESNTVKFGAQSLLNTVLVEDGWYPWARFFEIDAESPEYIGDGDTLKINKLDAQAGLFLHYMLTSKDPAWRPRLFDWKARLQAGRPATDAEFKAVFGQDFKAWDRKFGTYLRKGDFYIRTVDLPPEVTGFALTRTELRSREVRELLTLLQIINQRGPDSTRALEALLDKGLKTEALRDLLIEACLRYGRNDAVRAQLKASQAAHSTNPKVYALLADARFADEVPQIALGSRLTPAAASEIRALCKQALALEPFLPSALGRWAWAEALGEKVDGVTITILESIYRRLDGYAPTGEVVAAQAVALWRTGDRAAARQAAQSLAASPYAGADARRIAAALLDELAQAGGPSAKAALRR